jgi:hypothetical protein
MDIDKRRHTQISRISQTTTSVKMARTEMNSDSNKKVNKKTNKSSIKK